MTAFSTFYHFRSHNTCSSLHQDANPDNYLYSRVIYLQNSMGSYSIFNILVWFYTQTALFSLFIKG